MLSLDIIKDCPKMRNIPKIFLRSFENVGPDCRCAVSYLKMFVS